MPVLRYRLDELGWYNFEALCQSVLLNKFSVGIQAWGGSGDWGRDAFFKGRLAIPDPSNEEERAFVFQAKFIENANAPGAQTGPPLTKAVKAEIAKVKHSVDCYVLMTNVVLSPALRTSLEALLAESMPGTKIVTWGGGELAGLLDGLPELRIAFPQLLSPRDFQSLLEQVVNKAAHERSATMLSRAIEDSRVFIKTVAYRKAFAALLQDGLAVLSGPPEMGKTTIAQAIAFSLAADGWSSLSVRSADELLGLYRRDERQVFVADDAFGTTEYKPGMAEEWAASLDGVLRRVDKRHWVIWTSRTAPLEAALRNMHLQGLASKFPEPGRVVVKASALSQREKALMLYAHAKAANLAPAQRDIVRDNAEEIVKHPHFTPQRVQRFVREALPKLGSSSELRTAVAHELRTPTDSMRKSFNALPEDHKIYLIAALDGPEVEKAFLRHAPNSRLAGKDVESTLLEHFIVRSDPPKLPYYRQERGANVSWAHPSWRDLVIDYVGETSERRSAFLRSLGVQGLALALSSKGGIEGERRIPFLRVDSDWQELERRLPELANELDGAGVTELLAVAKDIMSPEFSSSDDERFRLANLARAALESVRTYWNRQQDPAGLWPLAAFFELSVRMVPLVPSPDLRATWDSLVADASKEAESPEWNTDFPGLMRWWEACELLRGNEPRFLRQVRFPDAFIHVAAKALEECSDYLDGDPIISYRDEYESEAEQAESIVALCQGVAVNFPTLASRANAVESTARSRKDDNQERAERARARPEPSATRSPAAEEPVADWINIQRLFADL